MTPKQQRFVEEYLLDLNATQAAIRAGYAPRGARVEGTRLLANANVADAIDRAKAERAGRVGLTADRVLEELAALAFAKLTDFAEWDGEHFALKPSAKIDGRAVLQVKQTEKVIGKTDDDELILSRERSIKLHDKRAALVDLAKHLGLITDRVEVDIVTIVRAIAVERGLSDADAARAVEETQRYLKEMHGARR